jgi:hypothetical protein
MAGEALDRAGEIVHAVLTELKNSGGEATVKDILPKAGKKLNLSRRELTPYEKSGHLRWVVVMHYYSIWCQKAGYIKKHQGTWFLTKEGERALAMSPGDFIRSARDKYKSSKKSRMSRTSIKKRTDKNREAVEGAASPRATNGQCFVIQPFDAGDFDKLYEEIIRPAIKAAGLEPYRVDKKPGVEIPIEEIEKEIARSAVCFAEISTDNPNVWYELGFAFAKKKTVCMIASSKRRTRFPFDIQHKKVIPYKTSVPSDFDQLRNQVSAHLRALAQKTRDRKKAKRHKNG